ncbi:MAG: histidine--tRNA ligase [Comamonadaceae bacterium]|nr:histidine--tRNA ligase [Comamonadaceae bacterium]
MVDKLTAVKGMNDILPPESAHWEWLEDRVRSLMARYAYRNIRTPILEHTRLFVRSIGEVTDIVEKEMYSFEDRSDKHGDADHLTMRPENGPDVDAELILLAAALWRELGLTDWRLEINCLGQPEERARHRERLIAYLEGHADRLDEEARRRLHSNPLRILDTKNPQMQDLVNQAPKLIDFLGERSLAHFQGLQAMLDANGVSWTLNPRLVRGLDYYNLSVFEFVTDRLGSQGTICAGGRYDGLIGQMGGKAAPAVGWALGVERVLELLREQGVEPAQPAPDAFAVVPDAAVLPQVLQSLQILREAGVSVQMHAPAAGTAEGMGSMKSQFKRADASGARFALIFGQAELQQGCVAVKALRSGQSDEQVLEPLNQADRWAARLR